MPPRLIAPSFTGYIPPRTRPGSWTAARGYPNTGQIVLQMGAQPPNTTGELFAGAVLTVATELAANRYPYTFTASVDVGPVTLLPRGHTVAAEIIFGFERVAGDSEVFYPPSPRGVIGARYGTVTLGFTIDEGDLPPGTYTLRAACGLLLVYSGTPDPLPYAEIIATYRSVTKQGTRDGLPEAPQVQTFGRWGEDEVVREFSAEERAAIEGVPLKSKK